MRMKEIPWFNRPWTKLKRNGVASLDDAELLAMVMLRGNRKENCLDLSNRLLEKYNFHKFGDCSVPELKEILGADVKAFQILAVSEICKRYATLKKNGFTTTIETSTDVYHYFNEQLKDTKKEHLYALLLDSKNRIIGNELVSVGTLNQSFANAREVFRRAIKEAANGIILVHNHPSGEVKPSKEDKEVTNKLMEAGEIIGINVVDHVIVGEDGYWSYLEET